MPQPNERMTLPELLAGNAKRHGARPAMREKRLGIWRERSWLDALQWTRAAAAGLGALGVARGDRVGIIGDNRPELYLAICAAQMIGAIPVPLFQEANATELGEIVTRAGIDVVIAEDQEQVDKFLAIRATAAMPRLIVFKEGRGLERADDDGLLALDELIRRGATWGGDLTAEIARASGGDLAIILFTSGTSGAPKGVMLSHDNIVSTARAAVLLNRLIETDEALAWLPLAWVGELIFSLGQSLVAGFCLSFPESGETALADLREIGPTILVAPPRVLERLLANVSTRMADTAPMKRWLYDLALAGGNSRPREWLSEWVIRAPLRNTLGLGRVRRAFVVGEAVGPEVLAFFRGIGLDLRQLYGLTEASGLVSAQADHVGRDGVGAPVPGVDVRISVTGEVELRGPGVFLGYLDDPEATRAACDADGWLRTGDAGRLEADGRLRVIDRFADMGTLLDGTPFTPKLVESRLKRVPYIREVVAVGDGRDFVGCLIDLDLTAVGAWVERQGQHAGGLRDIVGREDVAALIARCLAEANPELGALAVRRFGLLPHELDAEAGELTRMRRPRRGAILARHAAQVAALFAPTPAPGTHPEPGVHEVAQ